MEKRKRGPGRPKGKAVRTHIMIDPALLRVVRAEAVVERRAVSAQIEILVRRGLKAQGAA